MTRGGANRKPETARIVQGTWRRDRDHPGLGIMPGAPPLTIALEGGAKAMWDRLVERLTRGRSVSDFDAEALALDAIHWSVATAAYAGRWAFPLSLTGEPRIATTYCTTRRSLGGGAKRRWSP